VTKFRQRFVKFVVDSSICYSNQSSSASSQLCFPNSKISSYHSYSEISSLASNKSENSIQSSLSHSYISKNWSPILSPISSLIHTSSFYSARSSSLITLNRPSVTSGHEISNRSFYHFALVLWNSLPSHLRHTVHHSTSDSGIPELSTSVF
jgi:hypothetical protein